jgi:hypothetical protein
MMQTSPFCKMVGLILLDLLHVRTHTPFIRAYSLLVIQAMPALYRAPQFYPGQPYRRPRWLTCHESTSSSPSPSMPGFSLAS